jgi:hypothetical protein
MQATRTRLLSMRACLSVHFIDCEPDAAWRIIAHNSLLGALRKPLHYCRGRRLHEVAFDTSVGPASIRLVFSIDGWLGLAGLPL